MNPNPAPENPQPGFDPQRLTPDQDRALQESIKAAFEGVSTMSASLTDAEAHAPTLPSAWPGLMEISHSERMKMATTTHEAVVKADPELPNNVEDALFDLLDRDPDGALFIEVMGKAQELLELDGTTRFRHYIRLTGDGNDTLQTLYLARVCRDYLGYPASWLWENAADIQPFKEGRDWNPIAPIYNSIAKMVENGADPEEVRALVGLAAHLQLHGAGQQGFRGLIEDLDELGRCEQNVADGARAHELILPSCGHKALDLYANLAKPVPNHYAERDRNRPIEEQLYGLALDGNELAGALGLRSLGDRLAGRETNMSLEGAQLAAAGWLCHHGPTDRTEAERAAELFYESHFGRGAERSRPEFPGNALRGNLELTRELYGKAGVRALADGGVWDDLKFDNRDLGANALAAVSAAMESYEDGVRHGNPTDLRGDQEYSPYADALNRLYRMVSDPKDELRYGPAGVEKAVLDLFVAHIQKAQALGITWKYWK